MVTARNSSNKVVVSNDGSSTLFSSRFGEHYHSTFGAVQESKHIFIGAGLAPLTSKNSMLNIFEVGFGTGLNALLTLQYAFKNNLRVNYVAVEAFPVDKQEVTGLNYPGLLNVDTAVFEAMHKVSETAVDITPFFSLKVIKGTLQETDLEHHFFDLIYFDAFSPETQPEMWQQSCFEKIYAAMKRGGVLTTYSCKGSVKRALKAAGFSIEKLPGPPGKREFLRAQKGE